jgi:hypothetical protein
MVIIIINIKKFVYSTSNENRAHTKLENIYNERIKNQGKTLLGFDPQK